MPPSQPGVPGSRARPRRVVSPAGAVQRRGYALWLAATVRDVVVVGGGLAGLQSLVALRSQGFDGRLTMLCAEDEPPYDRPPLSKEVLAGTRSSTTLEADWTALDVDLRLGCPAVGLEPGAVLTAAGAVPADGVVLACGSEPVRVPGAAVLHTRADALALHEQLRPGARVAVVGAGWIGAEVATAAARAGCAVVVHEATSAPLAALPAQVGARTAGWYAALGIELRLGRRVTGADGLAADVVVAGIGVRPATAWLRGSRVALDPGDGAVLTDAALRTSLPGVVAVGDCAAWISRRYGRRLRVPHWDAALRSPEAAAASLLGRAVTHDPVPYSWSEQLGHTLQVLGVPAAGDHLVWRTTVAGWSACWLAGQQLVAVVACDTPRDASQARRLLAAGTAVDEERLAHGALRDAVL